MYYAFKHTHGAHTSWMGESASGRLHVFESKKMRDEWVEGGPDRLNESGFRTVMKAKHPKARKYRRSPHEMRYTLHKKDGRVWVFRKGDPSPVEEAESYEDLPLYAK